jgi:hypothetical protein
MDIEEIKELMKTQPASIKIDLEEDGTIGIQLNGRSLEIIICTIALVEKVCEKSNMSIDNFIKMLEAKNDFNLKKKRNLSKIINEMLKDI